MWRYYLDSFTICLNSWWGVKTGHNKVLNKNTGHWRYTTIVNFFCFQQTDESHFTDMITPSVLRHCWLGLLGSRKIFGFQSECWYADDGDHCRNTNARLPFQPPNQQCQSTWRQSVCISRTAQTTDGNQLLSALRLSSNFPLKCATIVMRCLYPQGYCFTSTDIFSPDSTFNSCIRACFTVLSSFILIGGKFSSHELLTLIQELALVPLMLRSRGVIW